MIAVLMLGTIGWLIMFCFTISWIVKYYRQEKFDDVISYTVLAAGMLVPFLFSLAAVIVMFIY